MRPGLAATWGRGPSWDFDRVRCLAHRPPTASAPEFGSSRNFQSDLCLQPRPKPFAHRAWWSAKEKQVPIEFVHVALGDEKPEWFTKTINPRGTVPAIQQGEQIILESLIIAEFFEDRYPEQGTQLLPKDAYKRAAIRLFIDQVGQAIPTLYALLKNQDRSKDAELKEQVTAKLRAVVDLLKKQSAGPFFLGDELSLADVAALPFIDRFSATLPHYREYNPLDVDERLKQWYEAAKARQAFQETSKDAEFYIDGYKGYAHPKL